MKFFRLFTVLIGLAIAGYLMHAVGLGAIRHSLGLLGWGYVLVLAYPISWILFNTAGWRKALHHQFAQISLLSLAQIRVAGETFNSLLPSGYVGGEPLKAKMLSRVMPLQEAASSVLVAKAGQSIGLVLFVTLGLVIGGSGHPSALRDPRTLIALVALSTGIGIFTWLLMHRSFSRLGEKLARHLSWRWVLALQPRLAALDDSLGRFYADGKSAFLACVLWHCAGWLAGALEVAIIFWLMGHAVTWRQAWFIGALAQLAAVIGLVIPAGVGLYEGGHYMAAAMLGLDPGAGLTVSLIRRVREVFWDGIGLFLFWRLTRATPANADYNRK